MTNDRNPKPSDPCVDRLKVLADRTRLEVVRQLMDGPKHVAEINAKLGVEQSLLSHHLKILRDTGLVLAERDGKAVLYQLAPDVHLTGEGKNVNLGCCVLSFEPPAPTKETTADIGVQTGALPETAAPTSTPSDSHLEPGPG